MSQKVRDAQGITIGGIFLIFQARLGISKEPGATAHFLPFMAHLPNCHGVMRSDFLYYKESVSNGVVT